MFETHHLENILKDRCCIAQIADDYQWTYALDHESRVAWTPVKRWNFFSTEKYSSKNLRAARFGPGYPMASGFPKTLGLPNQDANGRKFLNKKYSPKRWWRKMVIKKHGHKL